MPDDIRPGKLKTEAAAAEDRGDWAAASSLWQDFLAHPDAPDPLPPRAFLGLSRAEAELGRLDAAWDTVTRGLALHPGKAPLRERQAELASQRQDWAQAESCWQGCLADFPGRASHKWHHELARALQAQGKQQALLACLQKAVRKFPGAVQPRLMLARLYLDQGAWKDAAVYAERAVALSQEHGNREQTGQSTLLLARALLELGRSSEAWAQADAAKALFPASDQRFRNQYINLLCDTRETAQLKAEYSGGFLSSGHSAKDAVPCSP